MTDSTSRRGFTLIEVLVALVVLSVALVAMIPMLLQSIRGNYFGKETTQSAAVCQDKLEELRRVPYASLAAGNDTVDGIDRKWEIADYGDLRGIEVTTEWTDGRGQKHTSRFFTVRASI